MQRETFILRLWRNKPHDLQWHVQVQHVKSGSIIHVQDLQILLPIINEMIEPAIINHPVVTKLK